MDYETLTRNLADAVGFRLAEKMSGTPDEWQATYEVLVRVVNKYGFVEEASACIPSTQAIVA